MVNYADLDTAFLVPCKHCAELLQEHERICPFCGWDQSVTDGAGDARTDVEPERGTFGGGEALAPIAVESALMPRQEAREAIGRSVPTSAANEEVISGVGLVRPAAPWQKQVRAGGGPEHWAGRSIAPHRLVIGIVAALVVLLALALVFDHFFLRKQSEAGKLREFRANVEQVQRALSLGDLNSAQRVLDVLDADHANDAGVRALREAFDRQAQQQAAHREQLRDAAQKASQALGLGEPATPPARVSSPPEAPKAASAAPGSGAAAATGKECNEALAALALCPNR